METMIVYLCFRQMDGYSQEMLGVALGNYAGTTGIQLNQSAMHNSKTYLEIHFSGLDLFFYNNDL